MWLRPRGSYLSAIGTNTNGNLLEADSHADTTCLGGGALKLMDYNTPVNVHGYDASLGSKEYRIISGGLAYNHPFSGLRQVPLDIPPSYSYAGFGSPFDVPHATESTWGHGK